MTRRDRALGTLAGLAVGDALGMPTQDLTRERITLWYGRITGLVAAHPDHPIARGLPAGTVTDDTEQALMLARLLVEDGGRVDPRGLADALTEWEAGVVARGSGDLLGPSTRRALRRLRAGEPVSEAGRDGTTNGAAMRIAPLGVAVADPALLRERVREACLVTHNTPVAIAAATAVAAAVSAGVDGAGLDAVLDAAERAAGPAGRGGFAERLRWVRERAPGREPDEIADAVGTSVEADESVVTAFALVTMLGDDPRAALLAAANVGGDTDTVGAICGAVLGAVHGVGGLPTDLVATVLAVNDLDLDPVVDGLLRLRG